MIAFAQCVRVEPDYQPRRYDVGEVAVCIESEVPGVAEEFAGLYGGSPAIEARTNPLIHVEIRGVERLRMGFGSPRFQIYTNGQPVGRPRRQRELLPAIEWAINWRVIQSRDDFLQLHAATMMYGGAGVILAGPSGAGKSTLVAGLLARGWKYLSDEFALIHPDTLLLHPFPKAVCIKSGAFPIAEELELPFASRHYYLKGLKGMVRYINPNRLTPSSVAAPCPVRLVLFPRYTPDIVDPSVSPLSRARAAFMLLGGALNRRRFGGRAVSIICDVVRAAECRALRSGPIQATCEAIESLIRSEAA